jgi:hypothetical protein
VTRRRYRAALAVLIVGAAVAVVVIWVTRPAQAQVTLSMRPVRPLSTAACAGEAHQYGYSLSAAAGFCQTGAGHAWYFARLTNRGPYDFMSCAATAYDSRGRIVFQGPLPFEFAGIRGLFAPGHRSMTFYWYLPQITTAAVARFTATCTARRYPWA